MRLYHYIYIVLLAAVPFCAQAQIGEPRDVISIGVTGGVAMNKVGFTPTIKQKYLVGPTYGVAARFTSELYFRLLCSLQIELNYTQSGWAENVLDGNSQPLPDTYQRKVHYLQLPFLARLGYGREEGGVMVYLLAGPQIGYALSEKEELGNITLNAAGEPDRPGGLFQQYGKPLEKRIDYGIAGGLGLEFNTRRAGHFLIEGRYYYGLGDIFKNSKSDLFARSNNNTLFARFTYFFDVRGRRPF